jgi:hypothetical protein
MDYTLAQYKPETFEKLAYEGTIKKFVGNLIGLYFLKPVLLCCI